MPRGNSKQSRRDNGFAEWGGYMAAKKQKLQSQFSGDIQREQEKASTSSKIFEGVTIHVNGYTVPSSDELKRLMQLHGGAYQHYYGKTKVTHIIATMLPHTKLKKLTDERIVRPQWILDSIKAGELLSCEPYQLYSHCSTSQKTLPLSFFKMDDRLKDKFAFKNSIQTSNENQSSNTLLEKQEGSEQEGSEHIKAVYTRKDLASFKTPQTTKKYSKREEADSAQSSSTSPQGSTLNESRRPSAVAGDPHFVSEFYNNSRLHHISTWGAEFKAYVNSLQNKGDTSFPGKEKLRRLAEEKAESESNPDLGQEIGTTQNLASLTSSNDTERKYSNRVIMHIDMDCFFVSVGLINRPDLHGKPVAVTHSRGKGMPVVNKEAREYEKLYYENKMTKNKDSTNMNISTMFRNDKDISQSPDASGVFKESNIGGSDELESKGKASSQDNKQLKDVSTTESQEVKLDDKETNAEDMTSTFTAVTSHRTSATYTSKKLSTESFNSMAEIASCSYEARQAGVKNGMFMGKAKQLCPDLQMIPYDFDNYKRVSHILYETVASYTHDIEAVSCDEMYVDITNVLEDTGVLPLKFAEVLRKEIKEKTQCPASAGLAFNILLARMSTRVAKPDGQFYLESNAVKEFIKKQPVRDLPGVGWSTGRRLQAMGLNVCEDLQKLSVGVLQKEFGPKTGQSLYQYCRGIDDRPIKVERSRKSVSAEINYGIRFNKDSEADNFVMELVREVHRRLQAIDMRGKTVTLKMKVRQEGAPKETSKFLGHGVCHNIAKSVTLATATDKVEVIENESLKLLKQVKVPASDMRGIGIQISRLTSLSASASSDTGSKSLLDFVSREQPKSNVTKAANFNSNVSTDTATETKKAKCHIPTMLDFVTKQSQSEIVGVNVDRSPASSETSNEKDTDFTPAKGKKLPPLPVLPVFKTPDESGTPVARIIKQEEQFSVPSPSQLDDSVLLALPDDIRCQILDSYKSEDIKLNLTQTRNRYASIDEPSTSTGVVHHKPQHVQHLDPQVLADLPADIVAEIMNSRDQDTGEKYTMTVPIEPLPNISQIDPSCLEALPHELQQELHSAYERQNKSTIPPKQRPDQNKRPSEFSTKLSFKASPFKIIRRQRGRQIKGSPSKKAANQPGIQDMIAGQGKSTSNEMLQHEKATTGNKDCDSDQNGDVAETHSTKVAHTHVNLCGAVKLQHVKILLKEWMLAFPDGLTKLCQSISEPLDEDVHHIIEYLYQLILDRNLEMVNLVLRGVKRLGERCGTPAWIAAYSLIEEKVQDIVHETYGSKFKI